MVYKATRFSLFLESLSFIKAQGKDTLHASLNSNLNLIQFRFIHVRKLSKIFNKLIKFNHVFLSIFSWNVVVLGVLKILDIVIGTTSPLTR